MDRYGPGRSEAGRKRIAAASTSAADAVDDPPAPAAAAPPSAGVGPERGSMREEGSNKYSVSGGQWGALAGPVRRRGAGVDPRVGEKVIV